MFVQLIMPIPPIVSVNDSTPIQLRDGHPVVFDDAPMPQDFLDAAPTSRPSPSGSGTWPSAHTQFHYRKYPYGNTSAAPIGAHRRKQDTVRTWRDRDTERCDASLFRVRRNRQYRPERGSRLTMFEHQNCLRAGSNGESLHASTQPFKVQPRAIAGTRSSFWHVVCVAMVSIGMCNRMRKSLFTSGART